MNGSLPACDARGIPPSPSGVPTDAWVRLLHTVEEHLRRSPTGQLTAADEPANWPIGCQASLDYISSTHYACRDGGWTVRRESARQAVYAWRAADPEGAATRDEHAAAHRYARYWESCAANERRRIGDPTHPAHNPDLSREDLEMYERYRDDALEEAEAARHRRETCVTQLALDF